VTHGNGRGSEFDLVAERRAGNLSLYAVWKTPNGARRVKLISGTGEYPLLVASCDIGPQSGGAPGSLTGKRITVTNNNAFWVANAEYPRGAEFESCEAGINEGTTGTINNLTADGYLIAWDDGRDGSFDGNSWATEEEILAGAVLIGEGA